MAAKKKTTTPKLIDLTPAQIAALPKPRPGFEVYADDLAALYEDHRDELFIKGFDVSAIKSGIATASALDALERSVSKQLEMIQETQLLHRSNAYAAMLNIYNRAKAAGKTNNDIQAAISGFAKFMSVGPRKAPKP